MYFYFYNKKYCVCFFFFFVTAVSHTCIDEIHRISIRINKRQRSVGQDKNDKTLDSWINKKKVVKWEKNEKKQFTEDEMRMTVNI